MDTVVFASEPASAYFTDSVVLAKVNAEVDTILARKYAVSGYPTFVLVNPDGTEIDRIIGEMETEKFLQTISEYRMGIGTLDDLLRKMELKSDRALAFEIANKYKFSGRSAEATRWFSRVMEMGRPRDSLSGEARSAEANMYYRAKDYERALGDYAGIMEDFARTFFAENALIWHGVIYKKMGNNDEAVKYFEKFIEMYPKSEDVEYAQNEIKKIKESNQSDPAGSN